MFAKSILVSVAAIVIATPNGSCSTAMVQTAYGPMPEFCTQNNTATGAIIAACWAPVWARRSVAVAAQRSAAPPALPWGV